jgi:hypothetical protein
MNLEATVNEIKCRRYRQEHRMKEEAQSGGVSAKKGGLWRRYHLIGWGSDALHERQERLMVTR